MVRVKIRILIEVLTLKGGTYEISERNKAAIRNWTETFIITFVRASSYVLSVL